MKRYFIWNGVRSDEMHIISNTRAPIIRPEERVEHIAIPGRTGELTQVEGEDIYNSYIQTLELSVEGKTNVPAAEAWLRGGGFVTFDTEPERKQAARIINAVTFERHSKNTDAYNAEVQFYCEPVKRQLNEAQISATNGMTLDNPGTLPAYPEIQIEGSGTVSISIAGVTLIIPELESGWVADCENKWICRNGVPQMNAWRGEFPEIPVGQSAILWTGNVTAVTITPRWRWL